MRSEQVHLNYNVLIQWAHGSICHYPHLCVDAGRPSCKTKENKSTDSPLPPSFKCQIFLAQHQLDGVVGNLWISLICANRQSAPNKNKKKTRYPQRLLLTVMVILVVPAFPFVLAFLVPSLRMISLHMQALSERNRLLFAHFFVFLFWLIAGWSCRNIVIIAVSVADPWHFGVDPDPRIRTSD
jgi:hypothetical protein